MHVQYKRWMQDITFFLSVFDDNTPMRRFDAYRYGKTSLALREYFRICRWLTISWFGVMNFSNDAPNKERFQENGFYFSVGPDDIKLNLGYDFVREALRCTLEVMADAKGTKIEYERFEIKQDNKSKKAQKKQEKPQRVSPKTAPVQQKVLELEEEYKALTDAELKAKTNRTLPSRSRSMVLFFIKSFTKAVF